MLYVAALSGFGLLETDALRKCNGSYSPARPWNARTPYSRSAPAEVMPKSHSTPLRHLAKVVGPRTMPSSVRI